MIDLQSRALLVSIALLTSCGGNNAAQPLASPEPPEDATAPAPTTVAPGSATAATSSSDALSSVPGNVPPSVQPTAPQCPTEATFVAGGAYQRTGAKAYTSIPDLCVDTLETTVTAYNECVTAGKCTTTGLDCSAQATFGKAGKEQQPVVCIDYEQANTYCAFRGKRLPTLEEWEWVARSGAEARTYTWGNEPPSDQLCWTGKRRQTESCVVGTHPADKTATGALDMAGNVLEFVTTERDAKSPVRIAKGGAWNGGDAALFTNGRLGGFRKEYRCGFLGVRCVAPQAAGPGAP